MSRPTVQLSICVRCVLFGKHIAIAGVHIVIVDGDGCERVLVTDSNGNATARVPRGRARIHLQSRDFEVPVERHNLCREVDIQNSRVEEVFDVVPLFSFPEFSPAGKEIFERIKERQLLMVAALDLEGIDRDAFAQLRIRTDAQSFAEAQAVGEPSKSGEDVSDGRGTSKKSVAESNEAHLTAGTVHDSIESVAHRLAMTDLFVEKAQWHLEERANSYSRWGAILYTLALLVLLGSAFFSSYRLASSDSVRAAITTMEERDGDPQTNQAILPDDKLAHEWVDLLRSFILSFTAYGFWVLLAVVLNRGARACMDQRERLLAKRHALRQGRLMIHLGGWETSVADMEKAFGWNRYEINAFTSAETEAKAPWGSAIEHLNKTAQELARSTANFSRKAKGSD